MLNRRPPELVGESPELAGGRRARRRVVIAARVHPPPAAPLLSPGSPFVFVLTQSPDHRHGRRNHPCSCWFEVSTKMTNAGQPKRRLREICWLGLKGDNEVTMKWRRRGDFVQQLKLGKAAAMAAATIVRLFSSLAFCFQQYIWPFSWPGVTCSSATCCFQQYTWPFSRPGVTCENSGCVGNTCFQQCRFSSDVATDGSWYMQEPLYQRRKQWYCKSDCRYHCILERENEREKLGQRPVKYHGKWPFKRVFGIQEPVSVALSALNLAMQFRGWLSFFVLLYYKLPLRADNRKTYYEYTTLWHIYGLLAMNSWFWSSVFHSRDVDLTEKLDYSSAVALLGVSLIIAILRAFNVRDEATRVMVSAPFISFTATHILYLNLYKLDYGMNMKVCVTMGLAQLLVWAIWAGLTRHPSRFKLWVVVLGGGAAMLLEIYGFPPYKGFVDAHALWHAITIPLTYLWWSFIRDDAELRT